jgi:hypothetical protein
MNKKSIWVSPKLTKIEEIKSIVKSWSTPVVDSMIMNMSFIMSG